MSVYAKFRHIFVQIRVEAGARGLVVPARSAGRAETFAAGHSALWSQRRRSVLQDATSTNGRPNSLPWATLDLYFADTTNTLLRALEQAKGFGPRCLSVLRTAVQDLRAPPAVQTAPVQREMTNGDAEDWMVQAARAEAAEAEAEARHAADAEALLDDDFDIVVTGFKKQRERKRAKGKGEAAE